MTVLNDRDNFNTVRLETEDSEACFYYSPRSIANRRKTARRQNGNYAGASTHRAEVGKMPGRSMLMAESEIKRPRGHSSGKVQSPKFGRASVGHPSGIPLSSETRLADFPNLLAREWKSRNVPPEDSPLKK